MPWRVQLRRTKGWRLPPNTVNVARPTRWGNPFKVTWPTGPAAQNAVDAFRDMVVREQWDLSPLREKDLACWCRIGDPCHADVLLELANR